MKKIDVHCHTTNRRLRGVVPLSAKPDYIEEMMDKYSIALTVVLASYFPHKSSGISNFRLYDWIHDKENFCMFGSLDFEHYFHQGINEINELKNRGVLKGIKIYTCYQNIDIFGDKMKDVLRIARNDHSSHRIPVMFHTGYSYASRRKYGKDTVAIPYSARELSRLAEKWDEVDFIFSHMSKPFFSDMVRAAKKHRNIWTDMSGIIDSGFDEMEKPVCVEEIKIFLNE